MTTRPERRRAGGRGLAARGRGLGLGLGLAAVALACAPEPAEAPTPVGIRRLTRFEYDASIHDLFGVDVEVARDFPADAHAHGFDGIASAQALSPLQVELYLFAAEEVAGAVALGPAGAALLGECAAVPWDLSQCTGDRLAELLGRIWRRPPSAAELGRIRGLFELGVEEGGDPREGLRLALEAALLSPHFLFRPERDPAGAGAHPVDGYAYATRLAYFLWSAGPDDELLELAAADRLEDDAVIAAQVRRMVADPRSARLVDALFGQWLWFRGLGDVFRDGHRYPRFDEALRGSMDAAIRGRVAGLLARGGDLRDLLRDPIGLVDPRLAAIYRMDAPAGEGLVAVDLGPQQRRGILTEPALMTVLAHPFATSPARRGRFVLEAILCEPPAPPPASAPAEPMSEAATARERFAQHRADPACAGCHATLDPIGLAFERYDAIGAFRGSEGGALIDPAGALPGLGAFADGAELAERLADDPRFLRCAIEKTMTYALGRAPDDGDAETLEAIEARVRARDEDVVELLIAVAQSRPFRERTPLAEAPPRGGVGR
ncbi:MAG: DUF1592 domain-containing protein [Nannocystaceae bacterium]